MSDKTEKAASATVLAADRDGARVLHLNRPDLGNALDEATVAELSKALDVAVFDGVRLVVLCGAGRHFCTGFDLSDLDSRSDGELLARFVRIELLLDKLWTLPVPTLALAQGRTMGAGADLFAACRTRFALPGTRISFPGVNFGLMLGTRRLATLIGEEEALRLLVSGAVIEAEAACDAGLVSRVIPGDRADAAIAEEAAVWSGLPAATIRALAEAAADRAAQSDGDLARLTRSAAVPGLKTRIATYRAELAAKTSKTTSKE